MAERKKVVDNLEIVYEGLFNAKDLFSIINQWFKEHNYEKREEMHTEKVRADSKYIEFELFPWRTITDYAKFEIQIRAKLKDLKEVVVEKAGVRVKMMQGRVHIILDGYLTTDVEGKWDQKPIWFFLSQLMDKYIFRIHTSNWEGQLKGEVTSIHSTIKSFLNLHRY